MEHQKKVEHHLKKALEEIKEVKPRARSKSPARSERKESASHEKKERKKREPKESPAKIHVCREKSTGRYKKCKNPKKEKEKEKKK